MLVQRTQNAIVYTVKSGFFRKEFYFRFCRVDVHIYGVGRQGQMQHAGRKLAHHDLVAVSFLQRLDQQLGNHRPTVDKEGL